VLNDREVKNIQLTFLLYERIITERLILTEKVHRADRVLNVIEI